MLRDLIHAYRLLRKSPVSSAVIVLALALGIGANVSIFTAVNSVLPRPFDYPNLDRIMTVWGTIPKSGLERAGVASADFADFQTQNRSFELLPAPQVLTSPGRVPGLALMTESGIKSSSRSDGHSD